MKYKMFKYMSKEVDLKKRLFSIMCLAAVISAVLDLTMDIINQSSYITFITSVVSVILLVLVNIYTHMSGNSKKSQIWVCTLLNCLLFPALFLLTGGFEGGMAFYFVLGIYFTVLILEGQIRTILAIIFIVEYICLIMASYYYPNIVLSTDGAFMHFVDIILSFIVVSISTAIITIVFVNAYDRKQKKVEKLIVDLQELSSKDPLTNLYNKRYFFEVVDLHINDAEKMNTPLFITFFDIDHFKAINDNYGHIVGDTVLQKLADLLVDMIKDDGVVTRFGGEEFVILFTHSTEQRVIKISEDIRRKVCESQICSEVNEPISISGGISRYIPGMNSEEFVARADKNLYKAKQSGRNRIVFEEV